MMDSTDHTITTLQLLGVLPLLYNGMSRIGLGHITAVTWVVIKSLKWVLGALGEPNFNFLNKEFNRLLYIYIYE